MTEHRTWLDRIADAHPLLEIAGILLLLLAALLGYAMLR